MMGQDSFGLDLDIVERIAGEVGTLIESGVQVAIVVGGGNFFRGSQLADSGVDRVSADQMGMLATVINAMAIQDALEQKGMHARVMSAIKINQICEDYIRRRAIRHLEKQRVLVFAAGTGNPFFTTDTAASLRAIEIGADLMLKATKVDGVYTADPNVHPDATRYDRISYDKALDDRLAVMDATALVLCRDNGMPLKVFNLNRPGALQRVIFGGEEGTLVEP